MSGSRRPDWHTGANRVSPIKRLRRLRPRARPRFKGPSFNRIVPNLLTLIGLCAGLTSMRFAPLLTANGSPAIERRSRSATMPATCRSVSGITMTNSSPP